eukprot:2694196-Amphidinium_carterae.1
MTAVIMPALRLPEKKLGLLSCPGCSGAVVCGELAVASPSQHAAALNVAPSGLTISQTDEVLWDSSLYARRTALDGLLIPQLYCARGSTQTVFVLPATSSLLLAEP